jgi:hypothetical protein
LLDIGATNHMTFRRDFFEELDDNVDSRIGFANESSLKPTRIGTIKLKLSGFPNFLLHNVLYLSKLQRNLMSLVHIRLQNHSIHMFDGKVEIMISCNMVVMTRWEDDKLLKLKGTSTWAQNFAYLSHHDEGTLSSSLLRHTRFGHINYDSLCLLKKNGVFGLKQCEACVFCKHNKHHFHDSTSRAHRKVELIYSDLCGTMPLPYAFGNRYLMTFY